MKIWKYILLCCLISCSSFNNSSSFSLQEQTKEIFADFLSQQFLRAQSNFALFIPQNAVHHRYRENFKKTIQQELEWAAQEVNMKFQGSPDKIFFLPLDSVKQDSSLLSKEFNLGTKLGWTSLHAYWGQFQTLIYAKSDVIQNLPSSLRSDLANPLDYVLKVNVSYTKEHGLSSHEHRMNCSFFEIGSEKLLFSKDYVLNLTAKITP
ncbi:MAG: hypothetical protein KBC30_07535 [Planctomycetes bacterium]|jgi:hypothetical protein|nr:hypothetical protein [Planctomycetota bacterium]HNZ66891.1 hypothetical protein [Planctomycetota bacterium]HPY74077.1 hypothetical protein [Planctomycetota bacterium]HQA99623.1 hypothetical protein [Planctomycetota bacterium]